MRRVFEFLIGLAVVVVMSLGFLQTQMVQNRADFKDMVSAVLPTIVQIGIAVSGNPDVRTVGTGVVVRSDGYILTVKHNITQSAHVMIRTIDREVYSVKYMVLDAHRDLALLKVDATELPAIKLGGSRIMVGEEVLALGYPAPDMIGGTQASVSRGIVSGVQRVVEEPNDTTNNTDPNKTDKTIDVWQYIPVTGLEDLFAPKKSYMPFMLQIDASVNPGSSGGAIVNSEGELIGITHSMITASGSSAGLNFAIPIDEAITVLATMTDRTK